MSMRRLVRRIGRLGSRRAVRWHRWLIGRGIIRRRGEARLRRAERRGAAHVRRHRLVWSVRSRRIEWRRRTATITGAGRRSAIGMGRLRARRAIHGRTRIGRIHRAGASRRTGRIDRSRRPRVRIAGRTS
jgi:hypothetical protein